MEGMRTLQPPLPDGEAKGTRRVQLTVVSANHLPKMDTFGSCDPFVKVDFEDQEEKTEVVKGTYDATFDEPLVFDVSDCAAGAGEMSITVLDWDMASSPDEIGKVVLPAELMSRIVQAELGWEGVAETYIYHKEKPVVGKDKKRCVLTVKATVMEGMRSLEPPISSGDVKGGRRIQIYDLTVSHLPTMDLNGKCDPYVSVVFGAEMHRTKTEEKVYDASFEEVFVLDALSADHAPEDLVPDILIKVSDD